MNVMMDGTEDTRKCFLTTCFMRDHSFQAGALCPSFSLRLVQCLPLEGKGRISDGGKREHVVVDHNKPFSVNTDFSLAPVQKHCLIQTQRKGKLSTVLVF